MNKRGSRKPVVRHCRPPHPPPPPPPPPFPEIAVCFGELPPGSRRGPRALADAVTEVRSTQGGRVLAEVAEVAEMLRRRGVRRLDFPWRANWVPTSPAPPRSHVCHVHFFFSPLPKSGRCLIGKVGPSKFEVSSRWGQSQVRVKKKAALHVWRPGESNWMCWGSRWVGGGKFRLPGPTDLKGTSHFLTSHN